MTKLYAITHGEDIDGIVSMAAVQDYCQRQNYVLADRYYVTYAEIPKVIAAVGEKARGVCVLTDIGPSGNPEFLREPVERLLAAHEVIWLDHHEASWENEMGNMIKERAQRVVLDAEKSAGQIAVAVLEVKNSAISAMAEIARIHDLNAKDNPLFAEAEMIQKAVMLARSGEVDLQINDLVDWISNSKLNRDVLADIGEKYDQIFKEELEKMSKSIRRYELNGLNIYAVVTDPMLRTLAWRYIKSNEFKQGNDDLPDADMAITVFTDGSVMVIGDGDSGIDILALCKKYQGGGRKIGGGWILPPEDATLLRDDQDALVSKIVSELAQMKSRD